MKKHYKEKKDLIDENKVINKDELFLITNLLDNNYNNIVSYDSNIEKIFAKNLNYLIQDG